MDENAEVAYFKILFFANGMTLEIDEDECGSRPARYRLSWQLLRQTIHQRLLNDIDILNMGEVKRLGHSFGVNQMRQILIFYLLYHLSNLIKPLRILYPKLTALLRLENLLAPARKLILTLRRLIELIKFERLGDISGPITRIYKLIPLFLTT